MKKNYGIELLRIVSMLYILLLHCYGQGGILETVIEGSLQYKVSWLIETFLFCGVNIFGLISGYVYYTNEKKEIKTSNYLKIWLEVVFWGLLIVSVFSILKPSIVTKNDFLIVLFPVTNGLYWYITAYTGLFIFIPLINDGIRNIDNKILIKLFYIIIIAFSLFDSITSRFVLNSGYSFAWLLVLYVLGAIIKKCNIGSKMNIKTGVFLITVLTIISFLYKIYGAEVDVLSRFIIKKDFLISYTSPTILIIAIIYIVLFSRINIDDKKGKIIYFFSSSTFAWYIINVNFVIWNNYNRFAFNNIANSSIIKIVLYPLIVSIAYAAIITIVDKFRKIIFDKIGVNKLISKVPNL